MRIFLKLTKIDELKKQVFGVAAEEQLDKSKEIMDYASSKPHFEAWSGAIAKVTDGKSLGNVRVMHTAKAAGKLIDLQFDDANKKIEVGAQIVDDDEWKKIAEGVYTGFSVGGGYEKIWKDADGNRRYTALPTEISVVDNPCMYGANFECIKATGVEMRKFVGGAPVVKLAKSMYDVADLAMCLASLNSIRNWVKWEAQSEADGSAVPARLLAAVENLADILVDMTQEEASELTQADGLYLAAKTEFGKLVKKVPATAEGEDSMNEKDKNDLIAALNKSVNEGPLAKMQGEFAELQKTVKAQAEQNEALTKGIENVMKVTNELVKAFASSGAPSKNGTVSKAADNGAGTPAAKEDPQSLIKAAWQNPQSMDKRGVVA